LFGAYAAQGQVVITSGTISGASGPEGNEINVSGANFSLSCHLPPVGASPFAVGAQREYDETALVTFYPAQELRLKQCPGAPGTATYNAIQYSVVAVDLILAASQAAINTPDYEGGYSTSVSNVPFTMSGTILVCPLSPVSSCDGQELSISISGSGVYSGSAHGDLSAAGPGGAVSGGVAYQFTAPSGFILDTTTQGGWQTGYGLDGYLIAAGATYQPAYAAVGFTPNYTYTWVGQTDETRALRIAPCPGAYVACDAPRTASAFTWYSSNSFSIDVTFTDNLVHRVALYLLDYDQTGRQETVSIQEDGVPFDTETFSNFQNGQYGAWNLTGSNVITVTPVGAANAGAVVSGIFFGPGAYNGVPLLPLNAAPAAYAEYMNSDTQTQGTWTGRYGANGYVIANGNSQPPTYGVASVTGAIPYTWAPGTNDLRALQMSPGSASRTGSAYTQYASHSFTMNVNITDGPQRVSLYLLDWEKTGRQETITIQDAATGVVLYAGTFSGFQNGEYATWSVSGNVTFTVAPVGPASPTNPDSPVVSGIFFN
jgi:hypothetical protein